MSYANQLRAYDRQSPEDEADYADRLAKREDEAANREPSAPYADAAQEWAGFTGANTDASLASVRQLAATLGPDWADGLPI